MRRSVVVQALGALLWLPWSRALGLPSWAELLECNSSSELRSWVTYNMGCYNRWCAKKKAIESRQGSIQQCSKGLFKQGNTAP